MPGGGGGGRPQSDNTKFYKLLAVEKDASEAEVRVWCGHAMSVTGVLLSRILPNIKSYRLSRSERYM